MLISWHLTGAVLLSGKLVLSSFHWEVSQLVFHFKDQMGK